MELTRRSFAGAIGMGMLAGTAGVSGFLVGGCNIWTDLQAWVPVGIAAFEQVVSLVAPVAAPGINAIADTVKAGFAALAAAVNQYINAPSADKATFLAKVQLIFSQLSGDLQAFLNAINVSSTGNLVKIVLGLVNIILSTIAGFMGSIGPAPAPASLSLGGQSVQVVPVKRTVKQFKNDFNAECVSEGHPELEIN